ncbi:MAG: putative Ig domain-containing protein [Myxococcales bacterium]|nr:putative Ig domain-containing protein [Myxococcales bacterium]
MRLLTVVLALSLFGCGPKTGTRLDPIAPQIAVVGVELGVMLRAASGGDVDFAFRSDLDLTQRRVLPTLTPYANGEAMFRWTPLASDLGDHTFHFTATVDGVRASEAVAVRVVAGDSPISFRSPVGEGTTLDLARSPCAVVPLFVDDASATDVDIAAGGTLPDGATITRDGPLSGQLRFCPSKTMAQAQTIYPFTIVATDGGGARAEKRYTIVLGILAPPLVSPPPNPNPNPMPSPACDTVAPTIETTPHGDLTTVGNPRIYAQLSDAHGIYNGIVFWSTDPPVDPANPDLFTMNAVDMQLLSGTSQDGQWGAAIPSPVIDGPPGARATIYYLIGTTDDDDAIGGCQYHATFSPTSGVYSFVIKRAN